IIIATDFFGWKFKNSRLLADKYASHGYRVYVPDIFNGSLFCLASFKVNSDSYFVKALKCLSGLYSLKRSALRFDRSRKQKPGATIGLTGCYGGKLFSIEENSKFDATFAAHPSFLSYSELKTGGANCITKPVSFAVTGSDIYYNNDCARDTGAHLRQKGLTDVEVSIYKNVHDGWTTR
ncbi:hypothetical protein FISHEDRAFT_36517, partial [Fistulina hepatica ATCC 64428]